jgi:transposase
MAITEGHGLPIGISIESASPHEVTLVEGTIQSVFAPRLPDRLIGDKAYDSDELDLKIMENYGIEIIAPHKSNRKKEISQDGRRLRRFKRRWKVERGFAWIQNFRRLVTRYEYKAENFLAMVKLGCLMILIKYI